MSSSCLKTISFGFTLIELLVTISLALIISGSGIAYYSSFNRRQIVDQTAKTLVSDLRMAQNMALSQQKPVSSTKFTGYYVQLSTNAYQIFPICNPACASIKTVNLTGANLTGTTKISFSVLTQEIEAIPISTITVKSKDGLYSKQVVVGTGGDIKIN